MEQQKLYGGKTKTKKRTMKNKKRTTKSQRNSTSLKKRTAKKKGKSFLARLFNM